MGASGISVDDARAHTHGSCQRPVISERTTDDAASALAPTARALIAREIVEPATPDAVAAGAARACQKLCAHLARIVGETGIRWLYDRSVTATRSQFPWLPIADEASFEARWTQLAASLAGQPTEAALEAATSVVATLIGRVGRFIGDDLTWRLLQELWPEDAPPGTFKETT